MAGESTTLKEHMKKPLHIQDMVSNLRNKRIRVLETLQRKSAEMKNKNRKGKNSFSGKRNIVCENLQV